MKLIKEKKNNYEFLKLFALLFMVVDHVGFLLYPDYEILRMLGRIVLPLFMFQYLISFEKTSDRKKSLKLVWVFAFISQVPFFLFINGLYIKHGISITLYNYTGSIFVSLAISYSILYIIYEWKKNNVLKFILVLCLISVSIILPIDYHWFVPITILLMSITKNHLIQSLFFFILTILLILIEGSVYYQLIAALTYLIAPLFYKVKMNFILNKYIHYLFYPVHLLILFIIYIIFY